MFFGGDICVSILNKKMNAKCLHFGTLLGRFLRRKMVIFVSLCSCGCQNSKKCHGRSQKDAKLGALGTQNSQFRVLFRPAGPLFGALGCKRSYFGSPIHCERVNFEFFYGNCIFFAFLQTFSIQCFFIYFLMILHEKI